MENGDGNEGASAFHMPEWMVSSLVTLLFPLFLDNDKNRDHCEKSLPRAVIGKTVITVISD